MDAKLLSKGTNILKNAGCTEVFLFGSQAMGKAHSGSVQMLIFFWGGRGLPPRLLFRMHSDLEEALRMPVDLVDFDSQFEFYNLLQRVGKLRRIG